MAEIISEAGAGKPSEEADAFSGGGDAGAQEPETLSEPEKSFADVMLEEEEKNAEPSGPVVDFIEAEPPGSTWVVPQREAIKEVLREFTGKYHRTMQRILNRSGRYLPMIKQMLREEGMPEELAAVAMIESSFVVNARSPAGAVGIWQFIPSTGKIYGLEINQWVDQRMDPELSTRAAIRFLRDLYERLSDWDLAIAGYNTGGTNVERAQDRCKSKDFWSIAAAGKLRSETRRYVPKFYAFLLMSSDPAAYAFEKNPDPPVEYETVMVKEQLDIGLIARKSAVDRASLEELNAPLLRSCTPPSPLPYPLRVPKGTGQIIAAAIEGLGEEEKSDYVSYNAKAGESVEKIAKRYGVDAASVIELNRLAKGKKLKKGHKLAIAVPRGKKEEVAKKISQEMGRLTHKVKPRETVSKIARAYGVSAKEIIAWNSLGKKASLSVGQELIVSREGLPEEVAVKNGGKYTVAKGDTAWSIARDNKITVRDLLELNDLDSADVLRPGDRLKVSKKAD
ncbi:LysM peptidoglycan-binding domain-containing protein [bacterium]|nr:MAG: LysM peptidoglycan-binding domain-containing protein [bacterium]